MGAAGFNPPALSMEHCLRRGKLGRKAEPDAQRRQ